MRTSSQTTPLSTTTWVTPPTTTPGSGSPKALKGLALLLAMKSVPLQTQSPIIRPWSPSTARGERTHPQGSLHTHMSTPTPTHQGRARLWQDSLHLFDSKDKICTKYTQVHIKNEREGGWRVFGLEELVINPPVMAPRIELRLIRLFSSFMKTLCRRVCSLNLLRLGVTVLTHTHISLFPHILTGITRLKLVPAPETLPREPGAMTRWVLLWSCLRETPSWIWWKLGFLHKIYPVFSINT